MFGFGMKKVTSGGLEVAGIFKGKVGDIWGRKVIEDSGQGLMLCIESRD